MERSSPTVNWPLGITHRLWIIAELQWQRCPEAQQVGLPTSPGRENPSNSSVLAGILGLTGILGFVFYGLSVLGLWVMILAKSGANWQKYFISRQSLLTTGFLAGMCTYVLFWTFLYGMVHVY